ncbi:MAG: hypothetical protein FJX00_01125 [Alphaproteobacteria bacterium]|nr:hypothetical protein [Alphaproteobacteria bacterium]
MTPEERDKILKTAIREDNLDKVKVILASGQLEARHVREGLAIAAMKKNLAIVNAILDHPDMDRYTVNKARQGASLYGSSALRAALEAWIEKRDKEN